MVELWTLTPSVVVRIHSPDPKSKKIIIYISHTYGKMGPTKKPAWDTSTKIILFFVINRKAIGRPAHLSANSAAANMPIWPIIAMTLWNGTNSPI